MTPNVPADQYGNHELIVNNDHASGSKVRIARDHFVDRTRQVTGSNRVLHPLSYLGIHERGDRTLRVNETHPSPSTKHCVGEGAGQVGETNGHDPKRTSEDS